MFEDLMFDDFGSYLIFGFLLDFKTSHVFHLFFPHLGPFGRHPRLAAAAARPLPAAGAGAQGFGAQIFAQRLGGKSRGLRSKFRGFVVSAFP